MIIYDFDFLSPSPTTSTVAAAPPIRTDDCDAAAAAAIAPSVPALTTVIARFLTTPTATAPLRSGLLPVPICSTASRRITRLRDR